MNENENDIPSEGQVTTPSGDGLDRLKDYELATLMLDALRHAKPDALFAGGYEEAFDEMLILIDGDFEMIKAARFLRDVLEKASRSRS